MPAVTILASIVTLISLLGMAPGATSDGQQTPCFTRDFKTELVREACSKGGQAEAKDAMKAFMKNAKIKTCNQCHVKLAPKYERKPDAVDQFVKAGGRLR
jgi:hypothetical protein